MKTKVLKSGIFVMAALLLLAACSAADANPSAPAAVGQEGFDSPEEAVAAYLEGLRDLDFDRMLNAFAVETYVEHFDLESFLDWLRIYDLRGVTMLPDAGGLATAINIEIRRGEVTHWIRAHYIFLTHPELVMDRDYPEDIRIWHPIEEGGGADFVRAFSDVLNAPAFHNLEILGFIPPEHNELYASERNQENMARNAMVMGAEQLLSRIAVFELDGHKYFLMVDAVNYNGRWFLSRVGGNFAMAANISWDLNGLMMILPQYMDMVSDNVLGNLVTEW